MVWQFREQTHPKLRGQCEQRQRGGRVGIAGTQGRCGDQEERRLKDWTVS